MATMGLQGMLPPTQMEQDSMISSTVCSASASMVRSTSLLVVKGAYAPSVWFHHVGLDVKGVDDGGEMLHQVAGIAQGLLGFLGFIHGYHDFHD